jgi:predicted nucleotidyltransferase
MKNAWHQRSLPPNKPVDASVVHVLRLLDPIAHDTGCAYFVAGATARDLILVNVHGLRPGRATRDIDFGIAVGSWDEFALLKDRLIATGGFAAHPRMAQRMIFVEHAAGLSVPIDLIPFRGVESPDTKVAWPPSRDVVLNVAGFEEALASSVSIEIEEGLAVRVASVPGLMLLKLIAWMERGHQGNKDASDLYRLLTSYADAGNTDRLYDREMDLLESYGFDIELAGAELLGRDVAGICSAPVLDQVRSLISSDANLERLVEQMVQTSTYAERLPFVNRMVAAFRRGLLKNV